MGYFFHFKACDITVIWILLNPGKLKKKINLWGISPHIFVTFFWPIAGVIRDLSLLAFSRYIHSDYAHPIGLLCPHLIWKLSAGHEFQWKNRSDSTGSHCMFICQISPRTQWSLEKINEKNNWQIILFRIIFQTFTYR